MNEIISDLAQSISNLSESLQEIESTISNPVESTEQIENIQDIVQDQDNQIAEVDNTIEKIETTSNEIVNAISTIENCNNTDTENTEVSVDQNEVQEQKLEITVVESVQENNSVSEVSTSKLDTIKFTNSTDALVEVKSQEENSIVNKVESTVVNTQPIENAIIQAADTHEPITFADGTQAMVVKEELNNTENQENTENIIQNIEQPIQSTEVENSQEINQSEISQNTEQPIQENSQSTNNENSQEIEQPIQNLEDQKQSISEMSQEDLQKVEVKQMEEKIKQYDPLLQKAFELLSDINKYSLIRVLEYCNIPKDIKCTVVTDMPTWFASTNSGAKMWITVSKGNLRVGQNSWFQLTGQLSSNNRIFKDAGTFNHSIMLTLDITVPMSVLRTLYLNTKKVQPIIHTLYGYEPYNILDMSKEEYQKEKLLTDVVAIEYSEKYKDHIEFLINKSPYQAANCILALQGRINLKIQSTIQDILVKGNALTMDSIVIHNFEPLAEATRELIARYHVATATEEDKLKVKRYLALYFAKIEDVNTKTNEYVNSLKTKFQIENNVA